MTNPSMSRSNSTKPTVCVYCGSSEGNDPHIKADAYALGQQLGSSGIHLVYGGASIGLMNAVAQGFLDSGSTVTGIIPEFLAQREVANTKLTELIITQSMHERKAMMAEHADVFIALPGGYGTFEELFEVITWKQLKLIEKPIFVLNVGGYYNPILQLVDQASSAGFIRSDSVDYFSTCDTVEALVERVRTHFSGSLLLNNAINPSLTDAATL